MRDKTRKTFKKDSPNKKSGNCFGVSNYFLNFAIENEQTCFLRQLKNEFSICKSLSRDFIDGEPADAQHSSNNLSSSNSDATRQSSSELVITLAAPSLGSAFA